MHIEELGKGDSEGVGGETKGGLWVAKRATVGIGARLLFYPTLFYNVVRNKFEPEFHWWDPVDEFLLLGAVPFPSDIPRLKKLGVCGVITLNEGYETLIPTLLYNANGIENLVIATRDYLFAPSLGDICKAIDFIHRNAVCGKVTYVHCKAGRGRSTTVVLCYLVQYKQMTPAAAYEYVKFRRPRVLLAPSQWQAVQEFYHLKMNKSARPGYADNNPVVKSPLLCTTRNLATFDETTFVVVSKSDLEGYEDDAETVSVGNSMWAELGLVYQVQFTRRAAFARLSYFWLRCRAHKQKQLLLPDKLARESCSVEAEQLGAGSPCLVSRVVINL